MKKIFYIVLCFIIFNLVGCNKGLNDNEEARMIKYIESLDSYEINAKMKVIRGEREIENELSIAYLNPNYYKVCFKNTNGNKQYIVKNDDGVFVLTPSLNKEFKFDSQWPLNSSHSYLLNGICNDIKNDSNHQSRIENNILIIESKLAIPSNLSIKFEFYYDILNKKPIKTICFNEENNITSTVEFIEFKPNANITKDEFNTKIIMSNEANNETADSSQLNLCVSVGYILDGAILQSSRFSGDESILCYSGTDINYTIIIDKALANQHVILEEFNSINYLECGLLLENDNLARYYKDGYEISIYHNNLGSDDIILIADEIMFS